MSWTSVQIQEHKRRRKTEGLCPQCGGPKGERTVSCQTCLLRQRKNMEKVRDKWRKTGKCRTCGKALDTDQTECRRCVERKSKKSHIRRELRKQEGLCPMCGHVTEKPGGKCYTCLCKEHILGQQRLKRRRQAGECSYCGTVLKDDKFRLGNITRYKQCSTCFFKTAARNHTASSDNWKQLKSKFIKQNGCCIYTNERLILGDNASLDHIIPRSRGGQNIVSNLQWVTKQVNGCKRNLTHKEFIELCRQVTLCEAAH